ncbi:MAG: ATP-binding protein [Thermodesulfobacteriota bacterium]|nr:ATP-binding protein [Thermodesulfobacteriota bacterium]
MANPFRFGQVVTGDLFCNRASEIKQIANDLAGGQSIVLYSPRRHGKTSLLKAVSKRLKAGKVLYSHVDFFACNSEQKVLEAVSQAVGKIILDDLKSIEKFIRKAAGFFTRTRFGVRVEPDESGSITLWPELSPQSSSFDTLSDALAGLNGYLKKTNKRAAVVFDEFQQVLRVNSNLEAEFRTIVQHQNRIAFAFLGSRMHLLQDMFTNESRPFYNAAKLIELGPIPPKDLARFIKSRFKKIGVSISSPLALSIAAETKGHPDYAQRLCSHIFDVLESETVSEEAVRAGRSHMLVSLTALFAGIFEELPLRESQVMTILAEQGPVATFSSKILQRYDMGAPALHKALANLVKKDLVRRGQDKQYFIMDHFLAKWIKDMRHAGTAVKY